MKIESETIGIEYKETALWYHHDVVIYGQKRGHVEYKQDKKWCFYENSIVTAKPRVFDTQGEFERYLQKTYMNTTEAE